MESANESIDYGVRADLATTSPWSFVILDLGGERATCVVCGGGEECGAGIRERKVGAAGAAAEKGGEEEEDGLGWQRKAGRRQRRG